MANPGGRFVWQMQSSGYLGDLSLLELQTMKTLKAKATSHAGAMTTYARNNKKWEDITGDAKRALRSWVEVGSSEILIVLSHGVFYGVYLEFSNEKRFAIIEPTIRNMGPRFIMNLQNFMEEMV